MAFVRLRVEVFVSKRPRVNAYNYIDACSAAITVLYTVCGNEIDPAEQISLSGADPEGVHWVPVNPPPFVLKKKNFCYV